MGWFERVASNPLSVGVIVGVFALACDGSGGENDDGGGSGDDLVANYAFISPVPVSGDLGGLAGADALCNGWAEDAGIGGDYRALLSTDSVDVRDRLAAARGWIDVARRPVADGIDRLFDRSGGGPLLPVRLDPDGNDLLHVGVWSGSNDLGIYDPNGGSTACENWTSEESTSTARYGFSDVTNGWLDRSGPDGCDNQFHLYCFQVDHSEPLDVGDFAVSGRRMFVSSGNFDTSTGIAGADALCAADVASTPELSGATVKAFLADIGTIVTARLASNSKAIVRLDGLIVAESIADLATDGGIIHPPSLRVNGFEFNGRAFVGATTLADIGTVGTTCDGWTDNATGNGYTYYPRATLFIGARSWFDRFVACSSALPVYCLEE
ncbi:MAG: hypothetical protein JRG94_14645 [Deltaproteobacteria bacterium]|nr:hypothetical protein [Deltaproteobacteria bacterium]